MVTPNSGFKSVVGGWQCTKCFGIDRDYAPHKHECTKHSTCTNMVRAHAETIADSQSLDKPAWKARHISAWKHPVKYGEIATKHALEAYAAFADDYYDSFETEMGLDGYFGGHALNMLRAINASLTMGFKSRLESGAIHRLVRQLAEASGIDPDAI